MAKWIQTDGTITEFTIGPDGNNLQLFQEKVGGYFTPIHLSSRETMLVNEEGIPLQLPPNPVASKIVLDGGFKQMFPNAINQHEPAAQMGKGIFGDVVLLSKGEWI